MQVGGRAKDPRTVDATGTDGPPSETPPPGYQTTSPQARPRAIARRREDGQVTRRRRGRDREREGGGGERRQGQRS
eukprot:4244586-Pyramimonas_sp.AAC.1